MPNKELLVFLSRSSERKMGDRDREREKKKIEIEREREREGRERERERVRERERENKKKKGKGLCESTWHIPAMKKSAQLLLNFQTRERENKTCV